MSRVESIRNTLSGEFLIQDTGWSKEATGRALLSEHMKLGFATVALSPIAAFADREVKSGYDDTSVIVAKRQTVYAEGVAYDPAGKRFFVGSARMGYLFTVSETGELKQFSSDDRIVTILGIKVD